MEEHHKALTLLAHELQDYDGAEQYCELYSKVAIYRYNYVCMYIVYLICYMYNVYNRVVAGNIVRTCTRSFSLYTSDPLTGIINHTYMRIMKIISFCFQYFF